MASSEGVVHPSNAAQTAHLESFWTHWVKSMGGEAPTDSADSHSLAEIQRKKLSNRKLDPTYEQDKLQHLRAVAAFVTSDEARSKKPAAYGANGGDATATSTSAQAAEHKGTPSAANPAPQQRSSPPENMLKLAPEDAKLAPHVRVLKSVPLLSICTPKFIIDVEAGTKLPLALETLALNSVLSAPVKKGGKYIGVVDVMGILRHIDFLVIKHGAETEKAIKELSDTTAGQLLETTQKHKGWLSVKTDDSLWDLLQKFQGGEHRVPLEDAEGKVIDVLTQTTLIKILALHKEDLLGNLCKKSVSEVMRPKEHIISIHDTTLTWSALHRIVLKNVSAVAITKVASDKLESALSISHLAGLSPKLFYLLLRPVSEYLTAVSPFGLPSTPVTCSSDTPLSEAVSMLASSGAHRIWVTNKDKELQGMLSLSDIASLVVAAH